MKNKNFKHGLTRHPLYRVWANMKLRCNNPNQRNKQNQENYYDRGIRVCSEWKDFIIFYNWALANGYKKGLTLDRIDNDGNYTSSNCRFTTHSIQNTNKRKYKYRYYINDVEVFPKGGWSEVWSETNNNETIKE